MPERYLTFDRELWASLRAATPMTLREDDLAGLRGINERIDLDEVTAVYLPLTRLLNLYVSATQNLHKVTATFLGKLAPNAQARSRVTTPSTASAPAKSIGSPAIPSPNHEVQVESLV